MLGSSIINTNIVYTLYGCAEAYHVIKLDHTHQFFTMKDARKGFFLSEHKVDTGLYNEQKKHRYIFPFLQRNAPTIVGKGGFPDVDL